MFLIAYCYGGKDEGGLKREKIGPIFQIMLWLQQNTPKMLNVMIFDEICFIHFLIITLHPRDKPPLKTFISPQLPLTVQHQWTMES